MERTPVGVDERVDPPFPQRGNGNTHAHRTALSVEWACFFALCATGICIAARIVAAAKPPTGRLLVDPYRGVRNRRKPLVITDTNPRLKAT